MKKLIILPTILITLFLTGCITTTNSSSYPVANVQIPKADSQKQLCYINNAKLTKNINQFLVVPELDANSIAMLGNYYKDIARTTKVNVNVLDLFEKRIPLEITEQGDDIYLKINNDIMLKRVIRNHTDGSDIYAGIYNEQEIHVKKFDNHNNEYALLVNNEKGKTQVNYTCNSDIISLTQSTKRPSNTHFKDIIKYYK